MKRKKNEEYVFAFSRNGKLCYLTSGSRGERLHTVEALVSDHHGNSEKWSQLEVVASENGVSLATI